jgi:hypothetical protein
MDIRLTFNNPALRYFFNNNEIAGVRVKVDNGKVFLKPSRDTSNGALAFVARGKLGRQIIITDEEALVAALSSFDIEEYPYFILHQDKQGWIRLDHHASEDAPRAEPHVRLWSPREREESFGPVVTEDTPDFHTLVKAFASKVEESHSLLINRESTVGRPPRSIQRAKSVVTKFERICQDMAIA